MKIGILKCGHFPDELQPKYGDYGIMYAKLLSGHGLSFETWSVVDMDFPTDLNDADGWLVSGSRHGAYEDHPFIPPLEDFIRRLDAARIPMIGVCFGHQIIAQALGGTVIKHPNGWCVGRTEYKTANATLTLNAWHQDQVVTRPKTARLLASSDQCENALLAYGDHILTVQPHPEFSASYIAGLTTYRGTGLVPDDVLEAALDVNDQPTDRLEFGAKMAEFFLRDRAQARVVA
ncbi:MAG: type 1 glutamine amidotransferase [Paracoccaceae bacterium]